MKSQLEVVTIIAGHGRELQEQLNAKLKPYDKVVSVCNTAPRTFLVVIDRNVKMGEIKRVFREPPP